jgi:Raf kinase inhibitor-like YbhB/YbcL family protein
MRILSLALCFFLVALSPAGAMELKSPDVQVGAKISLEQVYTRCGGQNISPALSWNGAPSGTKSFALTVIDQDVKPNLWSHWIVVGLPAATTQLARGAALPPGARGLMTDFGDAAYDGPCPPPGSGVHHYRFTVWAMPDGSISPEAGNAAVLSAWLERHAIASASVTGTFER